MEWWRLLKLVLSYEVLLISLCFILPSNTGLEAVYMAAWLSQGRFIGLQIIKPISWMRDCHHIICHDASAISWYSAATLDQATTACLLLFHLAKFLLTIMQPSPKHYGRTQHELWYHTSSFAEKLEVGCTLSKWYICVYIYLSQSNLSKLGVRILMLQTVAENPTLDP